MVESLRHPSARPELLADPSARSVGDPPVPNSRVGIEGPFGRERCVFALPMGPVELARREVVKDHDGCLISDPDGNVLGVPGVIVHRMLSARWVEDTRRLAG